MGNSEERGSFISVDSRAANFLEVLDAKTLLYKSLGRSSGSKSKMVEIGRFSVVDSLDVVDHLPVE